MGTGWLSYWDPEKLSSAVSKLETLESWQPSSSLSIIKMVRMKMQSLVLVLTNKQIKPGGCGERALLHDCPLLTITGDSAITTSLHRGHHNLIQKLLFWKDVCPACLLITVTKDYSFWIPDIILIWAFKILGSYCGALWCWNPMSEPWFESPDALLLLQLLLRPLGKQLKMTQVFACTLEILMKCPESSWPSRGQCCIWGNEP